MRLWLFGGLILLILLSGSSGCTEKSKKGDSKGKLEATDDGSSRDSKTGGGQGKASDGKSLYFNREITDRDLEGRTLRELALIRNTIFARAGNPFRKQWLHDYFTAQTWYKPLERMDDSKLTELDRRNASFVADYEAGISKSDLAAQRARLLEKSGKTILSEEERIELSLLARSLGEAPTDEAGAASPLDNPKLLDKLLRVDQLKDYSLRDLQLLRNTIYARRGRGFKRESIREYFSRMEWYREDPAYTDAMLNETDKRNIQIILSVEQELGGPLQGDNWFGGA
ncbi:MAG TPA: YARHG domain-containing protein [Acidobacteriota bacterium]|nr:YARHG domain-containing protein [Acidobacteriota bacterium]